MPATILQPQDQKFEDLVKASGSIIAALRGTAPFEMTFGPEKEQPDYVTHFTVRCYEDRPQGRATPGSNQPDKMYNLAITRDKPAVPSNTKLAIWGVQLFDPDDEAQGLDSRVDLSTAADQFNEFTHSTWRVQGNVTVENLPQKIRAALKRAPDPEQTDHVVDLEDCYVKEIVWNGSRGIWPCPRSYKIFSDSVDYSR